LRIGIVGLVRRELRGAALAPSGTMQSSARSSSIDDATRGHVLHPRRSLRRIVVAGAARGFAGGLVATLAMSAVMLGAQKTGLLGHMPPRKITDGLLRAVGIHHKTPEPAKRALAALDHFAFGGASGALFGLGHDVLRARGRRVPIAAGLAYGTALWAMSYAGWVPVLDIMPAPHEDRPGRPTVMVLAHWVFGGVLAKILAVS
jgi:hypothetical protein